ncbi:putative ABC transporter [Leucosporidium creatinivorum]|uniref:Putative ABC transporter n=1 Tax=Leucosporidium creatinivorum TaxID=106004 RepID=A0A1Y2DP95_9BASI|nr:putative ABC transporter [Leucosporidium creatinivorum]
MAPPPAPGSEASSATAGNSDQQPFPDEQVHELARTFTRQSQRSTGKGAGPQSPFDRAEGTRLDPASPDFSARAWTETMMRMQSEDPNNPARRAGIAFRDLSAYGYGSATDYQTTVSSAPLQLQGLVSRLAGNKGQRIDILHDMDGLVRSGEMLVVLGPPGSGCSTFLKTVAGEIDGFTVEGDINYEGISAKQMHKDFRGEAIYTAEVDVHFPQLSVGDTLSFAARARAPRHTPGGVSRKEYAEHVRDVTMAILGISHTINTKVGNDFIRGVSGGERKRVTIAEASLSGAPLQCWDNSTRGLDSANAIEFCRSLKLSTSLGGKTACVSLYQAPQSAYDVFDKVTVLYEGRQIYFGRTTEAKKFFTDMGFHCPERQTTADFLTSLTSDLERTTQPGFEKSTPQTPDEFVQRWKASEEYKRLIAEIEEYNQTYKVGGEYLDKFVASRKAQQSRGQRVSSPYTLSYAKQIELCVWRGFRRLAGNPEVTLTALIGNSIMALIIGSVFYNMEFNTASFYQRGALLFFAILMAAFSSVLEILTLYAQRNIVEKHTRYAFYHPSAEAFASMLCDIPYKVLNCIFFSLVIYFMSNLRREVGPFFFFTLTSFLLTLAMSMIFRTIASASRTLSQALAPAAVLILALVIYTGFVIPTRNMLGWSRWMNYLDPIAYGFEALMVNEFHGQTYPCASFVPSGQGYEGATGLDRVCSTVGSVAGSAFVNGDDYINTAFDYYVGHKWRNIGIIIAFIVGFCGTYLGAAEYITAQKSKGEVLLFQRGHKKHLKHTNDLESGTVTKTISQAPKDVSMIPPQTAIFQWEDVVYDIKIKGEGRRILDHVDGWVKPGTLTALMGVSGAGKTTLLDVLATRVTMGVVTGKMLVDGQQRDDSFQRKTGYVQQQDLHLSTSTVREALNFSALLRQPAHISREEKLAYVDEVIALLDMEAYADAVVGVPGEGLNVEQRKRLTIGVELAAKPELLLFLDEPTSGLDSQTSWAICDLMAKLTAHGQAILCTIHQPSAMLFQRFDRLLFLAKGGRTVYFGEVGEGSHVLTKYFEKNGAHPCPADANPAEWMLEVIGAAPGSHTEIDWHQTWLESPERVAVKDELHRMEAERGGNKSEKQLMAAAQEDTKEAPATGEFAAPFSAQFREVQWRVFQQYWRTPSYIYSKIVLCVLSGLFIGFSFFRADTSQQGLQNQMFSLFMLMTIFGNLVQQIMPHFETQRALYEARERPSKTYSWKVFMLSSMIVELPYNAFAALLIFLCYYYPIGLWRNAEPTGAVHERGALFFLLVQEFLLFTSTFTSMIIAGIESSETAGNIANLLFSLCLIFCGVLAGPSTLPRFWIFMYRVSPFTYLIEGMLTTAVANTNVVCSDIELLHFEPSGGLTCGDYMATYKGLNGGYLVDDLATSGCEFCAISDTNVFLATISSDYAHRWRDFGILFGFIAFNAAAALFIYWLARVPKKQKEEKIKKE